MMRLLYCLAPYALSGLLLLVAACAQQQPTAAPPPPPKVTVSQPVNREVVEWEEYTGRLEAVEAVEVRARVNGYLQSIHFKNGATVKQGDLLFVIDPRPYQAELEHAKAELALAQARLERTSKDLARAPISGRISRNLVSVGNLINGGSTQSTLLTTIVSLDPIYCYFEADERSYLKSIRQSRNGDRANGRAGKQPVYVALADEEGFPHQGSIDFVDNRLDQNTGTITVRAVLPNPDLLLTPGLFARVRVPAGDKYKALMLPPEAVGSDLSQQFVFVVDDQNLAQYRKVTPGPMIDGLRVIRDGLQPDDWVIVKGVQRAKTGAKVEPIKQDSAGALPSPPAAPERTAQKSNG